MPAAIPRATYRLQLSARFGFDDAAAIVPYLKALGISHLYASPFLAARAGSTHGYDIIDHARLNPEFGGEEAFERLSAALAAADMGLILDFVPNHMAIFGADNAWWLDVLEWGPRSPHAAAFDIEWETLPYHVGGGILLPILGERYGDALEHGLIELRFDASEGSFSAWYHQHRLPIRPDRYGDILRTVVAAAKAGDLPAGRALIVLADRTRGPRAPSRAEAPAFKAALAAVEGGAAIIARGLVAYRPQPGDRTAVTHLHRLLERQHYRVAHWRVSASEINYRRFFDINDLAGIRVERSATFMAVHRLVAQLIAQGRLHGVRLDHIDGLSDPAQYCRRLQRLIRNAAGRDAARANYVVVEKILAMDEPMPALAGVAGTTGYEWLNLIAWLLVDSAGLARLDELRQALTRDAGDFAAILRSAKRRVLETMLASEFTVLVRLIARIAAGHWLSRDYTIDRLRLALELFILNVPVYRTYVTGAGPSAADRTLIAQAIAAARREWFGPDIDILDFLEEALTLDLVARERPGYSRRRVERFAFKVQQLTGPVMAKSLEDTAFYRYIRLIALNEVGGRADADGLTMDAFHRRLRERAQRAPHGLTATATHDTKRGEDARARILALSELTDEWAALVRRLTALTPPLRHPGNAEAPSPVHEQLIYQTLVGAWPLAGPDAEFVARMEAYAIKAAREGKAETSWLNPNAGYEAALTAFVRNLLAGDGSEPFRREFEPFARRVALIGALNSLSQLVLKATMPGVPDVYQGNELWDLSLVDPDNRRPVDFGLRAGLLDRVTVAPDWRGLAAAWDNGAIKLALTRRLLALRADWPAVFTDGGYRPLEVRGSDRDHVIAFARSDGNDAIVVVAGRLFAAVTGGGRHWPAGGWNATIMLDELEVVSDLLSRRPPSGGGEVAVGALLWPLPVAVLHAVRRRR